ncbi:hypothetical protein N9Z58_01965, partial [bacterium]|nr:hypothetical protein [bacterium]
FQKHYFTERQLKNSLTEILNDFRDEIRANQRLMLSEIDTCAKNSSIPNLIIPKYDEFSKEITFKLRNMSARAATQSTLDGIITLLASEAGVVAVQQLGSQILTRLGTTATSAAAAGGSSAMASGAAAGGGGGAFGGPVGIAVGACAGIAVGIVIDHFMNKSSKVKLTNQMDSALVDFERTILWGPGGRGGLNSALNLACDKYNESVKSSLFETVINKTEGN